METAASPDKLEKFDNAPSLSMTFCDRISAEEYKHQSSEATRTALANLMAQLDSNSELYKQVLKKRKEEDLENSSLFGYFKCKLYSLLSYTAHLQVSSEEYDDKLQRLKNDIVNAFNYAQDCNTGQRSSRRLMEKRSKNLAEKVVQASVDRLESDENVSCGQDNLISCVILKAPPPPSPPPPPPPPPPPVPPSIQIQINSDITSHVKDSVKMNSKMDAGHPSIMDKCERTDQAKRNSNVVDKNVSVHADIMSAIQDGSALSKLRKANMPDHQIELKRRRIQEDDNDAMNKFFNQQLIDKFKNVANSPDNSDLSSYSGFDDSANAIDADWQQ